MTRVDVAIKRIKSYRERLTKQQVRTLCGQARAGDTEAALKGLKTLLERGRVADVGTAL